MKTNPISIAMLACIFAGFSVSNYGFVLFMDKNISLAIASSLDQFVVLVAVYFMGKDLLKNDQ